MYSKIALFVASAFALAAMAAPGAPAPAGGTPPPPTNSQCNTGTLHCCDSVEDPKTAAAQNALSGLVGVVVGQVTGPIGLHCVPVVGGNDCTTQSACCSGNTFNGLVTIGCSPINIGL